ncbi:MAG TPA: HAMP domain-containing sensor histidine kinase [Acidimicrobiales bacterium]|nr:HAMP domain-containing sensor histidine kinase [Acidimicrobiales bacterium]
MSLRSRVLAGIAGIAVVLVVVLVFITQRTEAKLIDQIDAQLAGAVGPVRGIALDLAHGGAPGGPGGPGDERRLSSLYVGYVDGGAVRTLFGPTIGGGERALPVLQAGDALAAARRGEAFTADTTDADLRYRMRAYVDGSAGAVVVLGLPLDSVDNALASLIAVESIGALVIFVTLGLVAWWVIHLGVRPVKAMSSVASAIAGGDLSRRVPDADPSTEAGELGLALNRMLGRIESSFEEQARVESKLRQFVADASHELRTPVATIRGYAELYRAGGLAGEAALADAMRRTEQEALRMGSLVDDLLHLARLDQGRPLARQPVDLAGLVDDAARDARAVEPGRPVTTEVDGPLTVVGDESGLRQVLANLVGNALVHTAPETPVHVGARRQGDQAVVEVADEGEGMDPEAAARAFERFYRADPVRSRHRGGSGLGLAIVEATVRAHGGTVGLASAPGQGTTVRVELPLGPGTGGSKAVDGR